MAEKSWPWLAVGGDRTVTADMERQAQADAGFIGVIGGLTPTKNGTSVTVAAGSAIINGVMYVLDALTSVTPSAGTRKDYIILRYSAANRAVNLVVLEGTSGAFPTLTQTTAVYEVALASVDNSSGAFVVADTRADATLCGIRRRMETGTGGNAALAADTNALVTITFAKPFTVAPVVVVGLMTTVATPNDCHAAVYAVTTTQVQVRIQNSDPAVARPVNFSWMAHGY